MQNPVEIFELFFTGNLVLHVREQTILYASQKTIMLSQFQTTAFESFSEFCSFLATTEYQVKGTIGS